jgi:hypothetical protein
MRGTIVVALATALGLVSVSAARAQHTKRDAQELSAKLDDILRSAYKKPAPPKRRAQLVDATPKKPEPAPQQQPPLQPVQPQPQPVASKRAGDDEAPGSFAGVMAHAMRIAFDPDEWAVHFAAPARRPVTVESFVPTPEGLRAIPKTPEEVAAHLRNLPKTPQEVDAHLRRLDAALREPHRHRR